MKNKILVENQFGHGGLVKPFHKTRAKIRRFFRPIVAKAEIPFDWTVGFDIESKIGIIPTKNQYQSDSCGGQAKAYWLGAVNAFLTGQPYIEQSAKSIYAPIWYPGGGTTVSALEGDRGSLDESALPSQQNGNCTEMFMEDRSWMTVANLKLAMAKAGWTVVNVQIDVESIAEACRDYGGVIWEIAGQNNGTWLSADPVPPTSGVGSWTHFMFAGSAALRNMIKKVKSCQSWGVGVGENGRQYFGQNYFGSGFVYDVFTFVKNPSIAGLSYGATGAQVVVLQQKLGVAQTGTFDLKTLIALFKFQIAHGIFLFTGKVSPQTAVLLN